MAKINLLPWRTERRKLREREFYMMLGAAVVAGILAMLAWVYWMDARIQNQEDRNALLTSEIKALDVKLTEIKTLEETRSRLLQRKQIIEQLQANRSQMVHLFDELVKTVPEGIYLTQIKETGKKLEMKGVAQSSTRVSTFMRNIDSSSWMDNPQLQVVESSKDSPTGGSSFTLTSDVVGVDVDNGGETTVKKVAAK